LTAHDCVETNLQGKKQGNNVTSLAKALEALRITSAFNGRCTTTAFYKIISISFNTLLFMKALMHLMASTCTGSFATGLWRPYDDEQAHK
jgi:hypothetical protein